MRAEFPQLVSYTRFVELIPSSLPALCAYLHYRFGKTTGVAFIDSTPLPVCRIGRHRVFADVAKRGKNSMGWFYGFKLHLIVNDQGELLAIQLTPGNTPVPQMTKTLWGKRQLITPIRKNMQNRLVVLEDKLLTRKRFVAVDQLKNISQIEHTHDQLYRQSHRRSDSQRYGSPG